MKLARLKTMGLTEIAYRGRQEASKWLERAAVGGDHRTAAGGAMESRTVSEQRLAETAVGRFFAGAGDDGTAALLGKEIAGHAERTAAAADRIARGRFDLLGYRDLFFGDPIDWRFDPVADVRSPAVHWSRLNPLDAALVGDSKVVWELNRHQWIFDLGQAYRLTGDRRYAAAFASYVQQWMQENPAGVGINWASSLEAALRIVAWSWALFLFRGAPELTPELFAALGAGVARHAAHVEKYLSYYFAPNTHLTGEALGLFYAGVVFPELASAARWRELGARILIEQSERQILPDGVYGEQSTCYQRYTAEIYLHFLILAGRNNIAVPAPVGARVERLLDFLLALRRPDGALPQIGDADSGWLAPFTARAGDDGRGVFAVAAAFFGRADYARAAQGPAPELLWLLGAPGLKAYASLETAQPKPLLSQAFSSGGYVIMRSGREPVGHQMIFDVGPINSPKSGHGHADLLSVQCSAFGEPYLVDPGTYCYTAYPQWRDFFRGSEAHSTVTVDGASQAAPAGPFNWKTLPAARLHHWVSNEAYDYADAGQDAYRGLPDPVAHRRRIVFVKPRYWVIVDDLTGAHEHRVELRFQFAPLKVSLEWGQWARARGARGHALLVRPFAAAPLRMDVIEGGRAPIQGWVAPEYGQRLPAPVLVCSAALRLPLRIVTLLFPVEDAAAPCPDVLPLSSPEGPEGLIFNGRERIIFRDHGVQLFPDGDGGGKNHAGRL